MSFRQAVKNEVQNMDSNSGQDDEELEQIDVDMSETPFIKSTPTTLVGGEFPTDEGNPIILFKNNMQLDDLGSRATDDQGRDLRFTSTRYLGLVIDDPYVVTDEEDGLEESTFVKTGSDDSTDYRAVNFADDKTSEKFGGQGVSIGTNTYEVEEQTTEIDGRAILIVDRTAHTSVALKLDKNGAVAAGMDEDGQVNDGLIEYVPSDVEAPDRSRYARPFVELRDDLDEVGIMVTRRSEVDEDYAELVEKDEANDMMWYSVFDMETEEPVEPTTGDPIVGSYLVWSFDPDVDGSSAELPAQQQEFVNMYIENASDFSEDAIIENIEENKSEFEQEPMTESIVAEIQDAA